MCSRRPARLLFCVLLGVGLTGATRHHAPTAKPAAEVNTAAFRSAIVVDAASGRVLFEDKADVQNPPASVTKLMTFLIVAEKIKAGELALDTPVTITAEAARTGGSQVWLVDKEKISVEELLYALMVQSANDAAAALAIQVAGSKEAFVELMNAKAQELGLAHTRFQSPHGLPPARGQEADLSTARDLATLARALLAETDVLRYSGTREHDFRHQNGQVNKLTNHNHLLALLPGCDGLKTGWYQKAGYSLVATVQRNGRRIIAVILGSPERKLRDVTTTQLIARGFTALASTPATPAATAVHPVPPPVPAGASAGPVPVPSGASGGPMPVAPKPAPPPVVAPGPADGPAPSIKAVPLEPGDRLPPPEGETNSEVHVDIPGAKH
jgi:D-alanyl-D-alanine carboxypeptidase